MLDKSLVYRTKRRVPEGGMSTEDRIAVNLLWRDGVRAAILARVFNCSKNTIYYQCLTGQRESYPKGSESNTALATNRTIDEMGIEAAKKQFLTDRLVRAVNAEMAAEVERRKTKAA